MRTRVTTACYTNTSRTTDPGAADILTSPPHALGVGTVALRGAPGTSGGPRLEQLPVSRRRRRPPAPARCDPRPPRRTLAAVHGAVEQDGADQPRRLQQQQPLHDAQRHASRRPSFPHRANAAHARRARRLRTAIPSAGVFPAL